MPSPGADGGPCLFVKGRRKCRFCEIIASVRTDTEWVPAPTLHPVFMAVQEVGYWPTYPFYR